MTWTNEERRSDISIAIRKHEERECEQHNELKGTISSMANDINMNHRALSDKLDDISAWREAHERGDKAEHDRFFAEMREIKAPVIELKNAIDGLGTIKKALISVAQIIASIGVIVGGLYAMAHFGGSK